MPKTAVVLSHVRDPRPTCLPYACLGLSESVRAGPFLIELTFPVAVSKASVIGQHPYQSRPESRLPVFSRLLVNDTVGCVAVARLEASIGSMRGASIEQLKKQQMQRRRRAPSASQAHP